MRLPLLPVLVVVIINIFVDYAIYRQIKSSILRKLHVVLSAILLLLIILLAAVPKKVITNSALLDVMWLLYTYFSVYIPKYISVIFLGFSYIPNIFKKSQLKWIYNIGVVFSFIIFMIIWWSALVTKYSIDICDVEMKFENLPVQYDGYKIVQISDMHVGSYGCDTTFVYNVVQTINGLEPDLIVFTGDIVNRETIELLPFVTTLSQLRAKDGVISILGNHDYGDYKKWESELAKTDNMKLMCDLQSRMGWNLLKNEHEMLYRGNDSIAVIGVENWGDPPFSTYGDLHASYTNLSDSVFKILLSHNPAHWRAEVVPQSNIDLTLSGHTHAMQIELSIGDYRVSPAKFRYEEWSGRYDEGEQVLYVNIGLGEVGIPARFGAIPEITLITLKKNGLQ